jgi:hypothetical protein
VVVTLLMGIGGRGPDLSPVKNLPVFVPGCAPRLSGPHSPLEYAMASLTDNPRRGSLWSRTARSAIAAPPRHAMHERHRDITASNPANQVRDDRWSARWRV